MMGVSATRISRLAAVPIMPSSPVAYQVNRTAPLPKGSALRLWTEDGGVSSLKAVALHDDQTFVPVGHQNKTVAAESQVHGVFGDDAAQENRLGRIGNVHKVHARSLGRQDGQTVAHGHGSAASFQIQVGHPDRRIPAR